MKTNDEDITISKELLEKLLEKPKVVNKFRVVIHNFKIVANKNGKSLLQFTWTIILDHPLGEFGMSTEGCLCYYSRSGKLRWHPPINYFLGNRMKQLHTVSDTLYKMTLASLMKSDPVKNHRITPPKERINHINIKVVPELKDFLKSEIDIDFEKDEEDENDIKYIKTLEVLTNPSESDTIVLDTKDVTKGDLLDIPTLE